MKRTLLISSSEQSTAPLAELLRSEGFHPVTVSYTAYGARELAGQEAFDLICINAPLAGMKTPQKNAAEVNDILTPHGVLVIAKPVNRHLFHHFLQFTDCFRTRILRMENENEQLKTMVEDIKLIDRAKLLLVTCLNMSEQQAHRYLEKRAMDLRVSRVEVAKQVIQTYQN